MDKYIINISQRKAIPFSMDTVINFHDLTFIKKGAMEYVIDDIEYTLSPGKVLYVPPESRRIRKQGKEQASYISINFMTKGDEKLNINTLTDISDAFELNFYLSEMIKFHHSENRYSDIKCELLLNLIILMLKEQPDPVSANKYTQKIKEYVARNLEQDITLESIAQYVHLCPTYCSQIFKKYENTTINAYIQKLKINQACQLLIHTNHSVSYIAESLGYCDIFYFSNTFKKHTGMSPSKYRSTKI